MAATNHQLGYPRCIAKNHLRSVNTQFQNGAVTVWSTVLPRKAGSMLVVDSTNHMMIQLPSLQD